MNDLELFLKSIGDLTLRRRVKNILKFIPTTGNLKILDFGCGEGVYTYIINKLTDHEILSIDYDEKIISNLKNLNLNNKVQTIIMDAEKDSFPFKENEFDIILLSEVLEHLDEDVVLLKKLYKYLNKNGKIIITVPHYYYPLSIDPLNGVRRILNFGHFNPKNTFLGGMWSYDHKRLYKNEDIQKLTKSENFNVVKLVGLTKYVVPFYYHIIRTIKLIIDLFPKSKVSESLNKFKPKKNILIFFLKKFYLLFEYYDKLNKNNFKTNTKFVSYLLVLEKNN